MKTARERAREVLAITDDGDLTTDAALDKIALAFKEYARDQRHMIAEREAAEFSSYGAPVKDPGNVAHAVAMNTPFPGEWPEKVESRALESLRHARVHPYGEGD